MKTQTIKYVYDVQRQMLTIYKDGKECGCFLGECAEQQFNRRIQTGGSISFSTMDTEKYKKILIRQFHAALATAGLLKQKGDILGSYEVSSSTELNIDQLKEVLANLNGKVIADRDDPVVRAMRSELLTICNKMNIYVTNNDWSAVNAFFCNPRIAGKPMNRLTLDELKAIMPKMRAILSKHVKAQTEINRKKMMN